MATPNPLGAAQAAAGVQGGRRPAAGATNTRGGGAGARASTNWSHSDALYSISDIFEALKHFYPAPMYFRDRLFADVETFHGDQVACDARRGDAVALAFCSEYKRGTARPRARYLTTYVSLPYIKSITNCRAIDLLKIRRPGESPYGGGSPEERLAYWLLDDTREADLGISRREEWCCARVLFDGKFPVIDGDDGRLLQEIDWGPVNRVSFHLSSSGTRLMASRSLP